MTTPTPEYHGHEEFQLRTKKLAELKDLGIIPYPHKFTPTTTAKDLHEAYDNAEIGHSEDGATKKTPAVTIAGRLVLFRSMGKNAFGQIQDDTGRIQVMFNRDLTVVEGYNPKQETPGVEPQSALKLVEKKIDLGDIVGIEGNIFKTNTGEVTIFAHRVTLLCKTLLPLADKHGGLADKELRYRKRWLDLITHPEVVENFRQRSRILHLIRQFFEGQKFIEVETPVLQSIYGGAEARPFITKLNALDQEMFMRISLEIPLKKLIVGGMNRVYEIGRVFRNEGIDRSHNPEFTLLEAYAAYWDYNDMMELTENLFEYLCRALYNRTIITVHGDDHAPVDIELKAPWKRLTMKEAIAEYGKVDVDALSDEEMKKMLKESGHIDPKKLAGLNRGLMIAALFEVLAEPHLIQPHHITDHPIETTPLAKPHRDAKDREDGLVERFETFVLGREMCNAYSELNDPEIQRNLLVKQAQRRDAGDEEASPLDEEFIEAICQGMPPTGGLGIGIDRLVMLLTNTHSIRDVIFFPWMK